MSNNAAAEAARNLRVLRGKAATEAPVAAATACGKAGETMTKAVLMLRSHKPGERTPSQPGQPPATVSGELARSVLREPTQPVGDGIARTAWGSKLDYAPVQEDGAVIVAKNFPQLGNPDVGWFGKQVRIPARPWAELATRRLMYSGEWGRIGGAAYRDALDL